MDTNIAFRENRNFLAGYWVKLAQSSDDNIDPLSGLTEWTFIVALTISFDSKLF
jgi:hypothetical protein